MNLQRFLTQCFRPQLPADPPRPVASESATPSKSQRQGERPTNESPPKGASLPLWPQLPPELNAEIFSYLDGEDFFSLSRVNRWTADFLRDPAVLEAMYKNTTPQLPSSFARVRQSPHDGGLISDSRVCTGRGRLRREVVLQRVLHHRPISLLQTASAFDPIFSADSTFLHWLGENQTVHQDLVPLCRTRAGRVAPLIGPVLLPNILHQINNDFAVVAYGKDGFALTSLTLPWAQTSARPSLVQLPHAARLPWAGQSCITPDGELLAIERLWDRESTPRLYDLRHGTSCDLPENYGDTMGLQKMQISDDGRHLLLQYQVRGRPDFLCAVRREPHALTVNIEYAWRNSWPSALSRHGKFLFIRESLHLDAPHLVRLLQPGGAVAAIPFSLAGWFAYRVDFLPFSHDLLILAANSNYQYELRQYGIDPISLQITEKKRFFALSLNRAILFKVLVAPNGLRALVRLWDGEGRQEVVVGLLPTDKASQTKSSSV